MVEESTLDYLGNAEGSHHRTKRAAQVVPVELFQADLFAQVVEQVGRIHVMPRLGKPAARGKYEWSGLCVEATADGFISSAALALP